MPISQYDNINYAQYQPLSIQEIWEPGRQMRAQHDQLQEEYSQQELLGGAASLGLQKGVDDVALATNEAYMKAIKDAADELATKGFIDSGRRRGLMSLKQQYTQNVLPIQNALKERDAAIKMDRELKMRDSSYQTQFDPSKIAVTDYLNNNNAFSARGVSGQEVYKDAAQALSTLKDVATSELPALRGSGITDKYFTLMKQGLSPEQAAALMQKQSHSQAESESWSKLAKMTVSAIDGAMQRHGVYDVFKDNPKMIDKFWQDTSKAAIFAVGTPKIGEMTDEMSMYNRKLEDAPDPGYKLPVSLAPNIESKEEYDALEDLKKKATSTPTKSFSFKNMAQSAKSSVMSKYGDTDLTGNLAGADVNHVETNKSQQEIYNLAHKNGIQIPSWAKKGGSGKGSKDEYNMFVDKVIQAEQNKLKAVSPVYTIATKDDNISKSIYSALQSGTVVPPKKGSTELTVDKYRELEKSYGSPVVDFGPGKSGIQIKFNEKEVYNADGSIFKNQKAANAVKQSMDATADLRKYILDIKKHSDKLPSYQGKKVVDLRKYGVGLVGFSNDELDNGTAQQYLSDILTSINDNAVAEIFANLPVQNTGTDIGFDVKLGKKK